MKIPNWLKGINVFIKLLCNTLFPLIKFTTKYNIYGNMNERPFLIYINYT